MIMTATGETLEALYSAGHWLIEQERATDAVSLFRTMLLVDPRDERGWLGLGACHEKLDEPEKAIALYRLAASACDAPVRCTIARARLHEFLGDIGDAAEAYEEAARLSNGHDHALSRLIAERLVAS
jgi:tetratricopeptide (TPR) repeat protein